MCPIAFGRRVRTAALTGLTVVLFAGTARSQDVVVHPGLNPFDRTERLADGYVARYGPGNRGGLVEWREQFGTFKNPRGQTLNTTMFRGFNYSGGGGLINPELGAIGSGEEHSF